MDKALFRAYVRELVKEMVEEEVNKVLPKLLEEAVSDIRALQEVKTTSTTQQRPKPSRAQLAELMGLERHGDTITATTKHLAQVMPAPPQGMTEDNPVFQAINKDYSALMKKMGLSK